MPVGTFIATFLAAFGGGTLRDIMLMQRPFYWVTQSELLWDILFMSVLSSVTLKVTKLLSNRIIMVADAIGLGIFSATGTHLALLMGWPPMPCVMIGVITATFGGLLRDVVCNPEANADEQSLALCQRGLCRQLAAAGPDPSELDEYLLEHRGGGQRDCRWSPAAGLFLVSSCRSWMATDPV